MHLPSQRSHNGCAGSTPVIRARAASDKLQMIWDLHDDDGGGGDTCAATQEQEPWLSGHAPLHTRRSTVGTALLLIICQCMCKE